jgi:hypothetical protein
VPGQGGEKPAPAPVSPGADSAIGPAPSPAPPPQPPSEPAGPLGVNRLRDDFTGFAGLGLAAGPHLPIDLATSVTQRVVGGVVGWLRGGLLIDGFELSLDVAPVTEFYQVGQSPVLWAGLNGGYYVPFADLGGGDLAWPLRVGAGIWAINLPTRTRPVMFNARADLIGLAYNLGWLLVEAHLPSLRFATDFERIGLLQLDFGLSAAYVF